MDPKANIKEQRELAKEIQAIWDDCNGDGTLTSEQAELVADKANRLADLVLALDEWRSKGGFDPYAKPATPPTQSEMSRIAQRRPGNYSDLSPQEQWEIDKELGILDWDGK